MTAVTNAMKNVNTSLQSMLTTITKLSPALQSSQMASVYQQMPAIRTALATIDSIIKNPPEVTVTSPSAETPVIQSTAPSTETSATFSLEV
jgi:hypothetical protein